MQRAAILGTLGQQVLQRSGLGVAKATDQVAVGLPAGQGAASKRQPFNQGRRRHGDPALLEVRHDRTHDGFALVGAGSAGRGGADRGAVVRLLHGPQAEQRRDLAGVLAPGAVTARIQAEHRRLDADLVGYSLDNRVGQGLVQAQVPAQVAHQGKLDGKAEPVVRAAVPLRERQVLGRQRAPAQCLIAVCWRVEQEGARLGWQELGC